MYGQHQTLPYGLTLVAPIMSSRRFRKTSSLLSPVKSVIGIRFRMMEKVDTRIRGRS